MRPSGETGVEVHPGAEADGVGAGVGQIKAGVGGGGDRERQQVVGFRRGTARGGLDGQRQAAVRLSWVEVQRAAGSPFAQLAGCVQ